MKFTAATLLLIGSLQLSGQHPDFLKIDFLKADSIALAYQFKGDLDPIKIANDLTQNFNTEAEKFRAIFKWITENISYDIELYRTTIERDYDPKRWPRHYKKWSKKIKKRYIKHTIEDRKTICGGYAWLLETMCMSIGISCESIEGYARDVDSGIGRFKANHAWNVVKLNNKWYLSDPTWAAGRVDHSSSRYIPLFTSAYFIADPNLFIANHYPLNKAWTLLLEEPSLNDFFNAPIKTTEFIRNKVNQYAPKEGVVKVSKDSAFHFSFTLNKELKSIGAEVSLIQNNKYESKTYHYECLADKKGFYSFKQYFKVKGDYELRIYINQSLSLVYRIRVK